MSEERKAVIEYPCAYPVKVMGLNTGDFASCVLAIVRHHDPAITEEHISYRESRNGKYLSVSVVITATGVEQIEALFNELKASGRVAMVL